MVWKEFWYEWTGECWLWKLDRHNGYGWIGEEYAHRYSYRVHKGPIPRHHIIHHTCNHPLCVNPEHLVAMLQKDHPGTAADLNRKKTHCPHGHEYTPENTYHYYLYRNGIYNKIRECKTCKKKRMYYWNKIYSGK
jgi:hypothetical protein